MLLFLFLDANIDCLLDKVHGHLRDKLLGMSMELLVT